MCLLVSVYICFGEHVYRLSFCVTLSFDKIDNNNNKSNLSAGNQTKEEEPVVLRKHAACEKCTTNDAVQRVSNVALSFFKA